VNVVFLELFVNIFAFLLINKQNFPKSVAKRGHSFFRVTNFQQIQ
jgi:hypothetical protein